MAKKPKTAEELVDAVIYWAGYAKAASHGCYHRVGVREVKVRLDKARAALLARLQALEKRDEQSSD